MVLILSMFGGLGLDVPGEGMVITTVRPVDEGLGRLRCGGLAHRFLGRGLHGGRWELLVGAFCDGQVGADLADDDWVAGFAGLDDVDAQAILRRAGALADVSLDAEHLALIVDMIILEVSLDGGG